jgi:ubiquinone/menaquinone biosynthesis C-methylase UbiE
LTSSRSSKESIFRDTKNWYAEARASVASEKLINFCQQYAGESILDFGCATGDYCLELGKLGFKCVGVDVNEEYIRIAKEKGVNACVVKEQLPFEDKSFDTVIMFEVLEHVQSPGGLLGEAKRVAKKNILITVPNCGDVEALRNYGLTYEHFLETDHVNFFTKRDLEDLLRKYFRKFKVEEKEPIFLGAVGFPLWLKYPVHLGYKLGLIRSNIYSRLYAQAEIE